MSKESTNLKTALSKGHQRANSDEIINMISSLSSTWKQYENTDNKEAIIHTIHVIFLELYDHYRISFKLIEEGFKPLSTTFTRASCKLLIGIYNECMDHDKLTLQEQSEQLYGSLLKNINILKVLLILSQELSSLDILAEQNTPSYLIKIYHSFFDLPPEFIKENETTPIDGIVNILCQLSMNKAAVKQLVDTNTLILLFTMSASSSNHFLREKIHPVALVLIKFCLTKDVIDYLITNDCISTLCMILASNINHFSTLDIYDIITLITDLLEESTNTGVSLLSSFSNSQGYNILTQCLLHIDSDKDHYTEGDKIIELITGLMYIGTEDLVLEYDRENIYSPIVELNSKGTKIYKRRDGKEIKSPTINLESNPRRVKNVSPYQVLQNYFLASNNIQLKDTVLESIAKVFSCHEDNYFLLQHQRTIALFIENIPSQDQKLRESIQRLFLFIATGLNIVPYYEILALINLFEDSVLSNNHELSKSIFDILNFTISYDPIFKEILTDANFISKLLSFIKGHIVLKMKDNDEISEEIAAEEIKLEDSNLIMELFLLMLTNNPNQLINGKIDMIIPYLLKYESIWGIKLMKLYIIEDKDKRMAHFTSLMKFFESCKDISLIITIHECLCELFQYSNEMKMLFKTNRGNYLLLSSLNLLEKKFGNLDDKMMNNYIDLLESMFKTFHFAISPSSDFKMTIHDDLFKILYQGILISNIMEHCPSLIFSWLSKLSIMSYDHPKFEYKRVEKILGQDYKLLSYFDYDQPVVYQPSFLVLLFQLISNIEVESKTLLLGHFFNLIQELMQKICNIELISSSNLFEKVQTSFENELANPESEVYKIVNNFIIAMGAYKINTIEMARFFKLMDPCNDSKYLKEHLSTLTSMIQLGVNNLSPFFYFDHSTSDSGNVSATINNASWPSNYGFSVSFWVYFDRLSPESVDILTISNSKILFSVTFLKGQLYIQSIENEEIVIDSMRFQTNKWYHIVIVHEKRRIVTSETKVYIDGLIRATKKENLMIPVSTTINVTLGSSIKKIKSNNEVAKALWRLGPFYIFDLSLNSQDIYSMYNLGHSYYGNFQGSLLEYFTYECLNSRFLITFEELTNLDPKYIGLNKLTLSNPIPQDRILISINAAKQLIIEEFGNDNKDFYSPTGSPKGLEQLSTSKSNNELSKSRRGEGASVNVRIISDLKFESLNSPILCLPSPLPYNMYSLNGIETLLFLFEYSSSIDILNIQEGKLQLNEGDPSLSYIVLKGILHYVKKISHNFIEFGKKNAYSIITLILKKNPLLITKEKIQLLFEFIGISKEQIVSETQDKGTPRQNRIHTSTLSNVLAFKYFILDYNVWKKCSVELKIEIFEYLQTLFESNPSYRFNASRLHRLNTFLMFINTFKDNDIVPELYQSIVTFLGNMMMSSLEANDIRSLANFIIYTFTKKSELSSDRLDSLRSMLVTMLYQVILRTHVHSFAKIFECNWMFLFFNNETNPHTISTMLKILCVFFKEKQGYLSKFTKYHGMKLLENSLMKFNDNIDIYCTLLCMIFKRSPDELPTEVNENCNFIDLFPSPENGYSIECKHILYMIPILIKQHLSDQLEYIKENPTKDMTWSPTIDDTTGVQSGSPRRKRSKSCVNHSPTRIRPSPEIKPKPNDLENLRFDKLQRPLRRSSISKAKTTVTEALRNVIKGRQKREQSKLSVHLPPKLFGGKVIQTFKASSKVIPYFFSMNESFYRYDSPYDINNRRLTLIKELIRFIDHLYTYSHQLKEILNSKYDFVHHIILILFQEDGLLLDYSSSSSDYIDVYRFSNLVLDLLSNIIIEHTVFNNAFKESFLDDVLEITPHFGMKMSQAFCNHLLEKSYDKILQLYKRETYDSPKYIHTIIKFCNYTIDKLCIKLYSKGLEHILPYLSDHIKYILTRKIELKQELESLMKTLNRLIIVSLMDIQYSKDDAHILNTLTIILNHQSSILLQENSDKEFYVCLCSILLSLLHNEMTEIKDTVVGLLRMIILNKFDILEIILKKQDEKLGSPIDGIQLILQSELKPFLSWFSKIKNISDLFDENVEKLKKMIFANEDKIAEDKKIQLKKNYQLGKHRISRRKELKRQALDVIKSFSNRMLSRIEDSESNKFINIMDGWEDFNNYITKQWAIRRLVLFDEQQIWGTKKSHILQKWKLDGTENHKRMRFKLVRNHDFYYHYPYVSTSIRASTKGEEIYPTDTPQSTDAKLFIALSEEEREIANRNDYYIKRISKIYQYENNYYYSPDSMLVRKSISTGNDTDKEDPYISTNESDHENLTSVSSRTSLDLELEQHSNKNKSEAGDISLSNDDYSSEDEFDSDADLSSDVTSNQEELEDEEFENKLSRYLLPGDPPVHIYNAGKVEGLDKVDGICILSKQCVYFIQNLTYVDGTISRLKSNSKGQYDSMDFTMDSSGNKVTKWLYYDIEQILERRYLLRPIAIEIFSRDGRNCLLVFDINERNVILDKINETIQLSNSYKQDLTLQEYTDLWVQGQLSNFDYLMKLNTFAGRSYNDLTQYPIFPWVLKDYVSQFMDLNDPSVYRDLSKPMGAIGEERKLKFIERYESLEGGEMPPFHYGSHYSNAAIVLHYMIRMEPFTQYFIKLQEGKFDRPDRLFDSIQEAWLSASEENMVDVKELIPEFFYLPEFLCNSNKFLFGKKETGEFIDNIILPPWAENDPRKFIDIHRKALESPYVSSTLHHWIDLIFGYKQQGQHAKDSLNLFYYLTYEGAVDIDKVTDPTERQGIIDQINNFGQTPTQLFMKPHPKRIKTNPDNPLLLTMKEDQLFISHVKKTNNAIGEISVSSTGERVTILEPMKLLIPPHNNRYVAWGYNDVCLRFWEGNKLISTCSNIYHPSGIITCVATSVDGRVLVTGGTDNVVRVHHLEWIKKPIFLYNQDMKLEGHMSSILQVAVSRSLSIVVSVDTGGFIFVWDLHTGKYLRSLDIENENNEDMTNQQRIFIIIDPDNGIISISKPHSLYIWSVNGDLIAFKHFEEEELVTSLTSYYCQMNFDDNIHFITGHIDGSICVYELEIASIDPSKEKKTGSSNLILKNCFKKHNAMITSLFYSYTSRSFFSGDSSGNVLRWDEKKEERMY